MYFHDCNFSFPCSEADVSGGGTSRIESSKKLAGQKPAVWTWMLALACSSLTSSFTPTRRGGGGGGRGGGGRRRGGGGVFFIAGPRDIDDKSFWQEIEPQMTAGGDGGTFDLV